VFVISTKIDTLKLIPMRRLSIISIITLLLFGSCGDDKKIENETRSVKKEKATLYPCGTAPRDAFEELQEQLKVVDTSDSLLAIYKVHLDSLQLNWDSLVSSENIQMAVLSKTLDHLVKHSGHDKAKVATIRNSFCLVESNRLPADKINNAERLALFDSLLLGIYRECEVQILDLVHVPQHVGNEEKGIDADSLLRLINDPLLIDEFFLAEAYEKIIWVNNNLYLESVATYNAFIEKYKKELEEKGLNKLEKFPNFYE